MNKIQEEQIEELSLDYAKTITKNDTYQKYLIEAFIEGYNKASSMLFTEEQMRESFLEGSRVTFNYTSENITIEEFDKSEDEYIQSFKQETKITIK